MHQKQKNKRKFIHSIKGHLILMVILAVILITISYMAITLPLASKDISTLAENYMADLAYSYGNQLTNAKDHGTELTREYLKEKLSIVGLTNIDSSYAYFVDKNGTILYHLTDSKIGTPIQNSIISSVATQLQKGIVPKSSTAEYEDMGIAKYCAYYVPDDGSFILVVVSDKREILSPLRAISNRMFFGGIFISIICIAVFYLYASKLTRLIHALSNQAEQMAGLDFRDDDILVKLTRKKTEIGDISSSMLKLKQELIMIIKELKQHSNTLFHSAESLNSNCQETAATMEQVEQAVYDIASGSSSQAADTEAARDSIVDIGNMIQQTVGSIHALNSNMELMNVSGEAATTNLKQLKDINTQAQKSIEDIYHQTNVTNQSALKIREAVAIITAIADETNLLSLNASIEASHAGQFGRGFSVVASQIKALAEQSSTSAKEIDSIVSTLLSDSAQAVSTMKDVKHIMERQSEQVDTTDLKFQDVHHKLNESITEVSQIKTYSSQMDNANNDVLSNIHNLSSTAEENAANTEETSTSLEEVSSIVTNISASTGSLEGIATDLENSMNRFLIS